MTTNERELLEALGRLRLEAMHYRNTGKGQRFLDTALQQATTIRGEYRQLPRQVAR